MINGDIVSKAFDYAKEKHSGQEDDNGNDYFGSHVLQVYSLICMVSDDPDLKCAALLHDVVEDCNVSPVELEKTFGKEVADLVMEVTHEGQKDNFGFYFPRLKTQNGIVLKFADRLSNLSRMESWPEDRKKQYLRKSKFWKDGTERKK